METGPPNEQWVRAYPRLWRFLFGLTGSVPDAEALVARVYRRYRRRPRRYRSPPALFRAAWVEARHTLPRSQRAAPIPASGSPVAFSALAPTDRALLLARVLLDADDVALAHLLGGTAHRVRERLRRPALAAWAPAGAGDSVLAAWLDSGFASASGRWDGASPPPGRILRWQRLAPWALLAVAAVAAGYVATRPPPPFGGLVPPPVPPGSIPAADRLDAVFRAASDPLRPSAPMVAWHPSDRPWLRAFMHALLTARPVTRGSPARYAASAPLLALQLTDGRTWGLGLAMVNTSRGLRPEDNTIVLEQGLGSRRLWSPYLYTVLTQDTTRLFPSAAAGAWDQVTVQVSPDGRLRFSASNFLASRLTLYVEPLQAGFSAPVTASVGPPTPASFLLGSVAVRNGHAVWNGSLAPGPRWQTYLPVHNWFLVLQATGAAPYYGLSFVSQAYPLGWSYRPPVAPITSPDAALAALPQVVAFYTEGTGQGRDPEGIQVPEVFPLWPSRPGIYRLTWTGAGTRPVAAILTVTAAAQGPNFWVTAHLAWPNSPPQGLYADWLVTRQATILASAGNVG